MLFRKIWKSSIFGMTDEEFQEIKQSKGTGPDIDKFVEFYNIDCWFIGILISIIFLIMWCYL